MQKQFIIIAILVLAAILSTQVAIAGEKPFAKIVSALEGAPPEGFTIGRGRTAYNGSVDGSIYFFEGKQPIDDVFTSMRMISQIVWGMQIPLAFGSAFNPN